MGGGPGGRLLWGAMLAVAACTAAVRADDWPQWRGAGRDGMWRETGLLERFPATQTAPRWRAAVGPGYSGPTVAAGRVYLTDRVVEPRQEERILCFDAETGRPIWKVAYEAAYGGVGYPAGPRASVTVDRGLAYALGATGFLHCLDAATGAVVWRRDMNTDYRIRMPIWGISCAPLIHEDLVLLQIGGEGACFVALERLTGKERWRALPDRAAYCTPILVPQAGKRVMVSWTGERVVGLEAGTGQLLWEYPAAATRMPIVIATPVVRNDLIFFTSFYDGAIMLRLRKDAPGVEKVWHRRGANERQTDGLHSIISTPLMLGDYVYGVDSYGELRCLDAKTGERLWEDLTAVPQARWSTIHFVQNGERTWMFNERGQLIIARLGPRGYQEISRTQILQPTRVQLNQRGGVCWSHPAFAGKRVFARNDEELVCVDLAAGAKG